MKKRKKIVILMITLLLGVKNVSAKDTAYSINKYQDEKFTFIEKSYNKNKKVDGFITGGSILKETIEKDENTYNDYQVILVKYNKSGEILWSFLYGKTREDYINDLEYTYDEEGNRNGYLIAMENTYDIDAEEIPFGTLFLKVNLDGKLETELSKEETIEKIIPTYQEDKKVDGYIAIGRKGKNSIIKKYDIELNEIWSSEYSNEEYEETHYTDITPIQEDQKIVGYATIRQYENANKVVKADLIRFDLEGKESTTLKDSLGKYNSYFLEEANDGFILYGITSEVKLKKGEKSYYLINYNSNNEESWEAIGNTPINNKKKIILLPVKTEEKIVEYLLFYSNESDSSKEVIKLDLEGMYQKKVKKINNDYYTFENFTSSNDIIYFVGQINCPEDDNCDYDLNSLFLISDEDKVIEVEDKDSKNIIIAMGIFIIVIITTILYERKRKEIKIIIT